MDSDTQKPSRVGPLRGLKGVLLGGIGPAPFAAMLLADLGAAITCIERPGSAQADTSLHEASQIFRRGQEIVELDLTSRPGLEAAWKLIDDADILIEGFRPGVLEKLGFGPNVCHSRNPRLVIGRITGWGQEGPLATSPGHDLNYLALTGALAAMAARQDAEGRAIPLNLCGDFAGGGLWACFGILAAIHERSHSGQGQVVDAAMVDGVLSLMSMAFAAYQMGSLKTPPGTSALDGGAHFYDTYFCADGKEISVGAVELQFYENLSKSTGLEDDRPADRFDESRWPTLKTRLARQLRQRSRDAWCSDERMSGACVAPVLTLDEVAAHPHHVARRSFMANASLTLPVPGPRFSRTPAATPPGYAIASGMAAPLSMNSIED